MAQTSSLTVQIRALVALGLPLVGSNMAQFAIQMTDTIMLGWYGVDALAASVIASSMFFVLFILGSGFGFAVMPIVAAAASRDDQTQIRRVTRMAAWLAAGYGAVVLPVMLWSGPVLLALGQDEQVAADAQQYLRIAGFGIFPALGVVVLKSYLSALEHTRIVLWATLAAVALNAAINWVLIFGNLGFPEMGLEGAAWASVGSATLSMMVLALYAVRVLPEHSLFARIWRADPEALGEVFRLGGPIGLTYLAESGLFTASAVMMGWLGHVTLAAHGVALNLAAITFMVHMGVANAATVRVGQAHGRGDAAAMRQVGLVATGLSVSFSIVAIALFVFLPDLLVSAFVDPADPQRDAILGVGAQLLAVAALFQLFDGAQAVGLGLLRGAQDTRAPMLIAVVSYWGLGITASYVLGFVMAFGGVGVWLGLVVGLAAASIALMTRFFRRAAPKVAA
ncbi:MAG: MATE family efflux transporter [Brevirhabdus sp.]